MKSLRKLTLTAITLLITACTQQGDMNDLQQQLQDIRSKPSGQLEEPPHFNTYENFVYKATLLRSPFQKPMEEEVRRVEKLSGPKVQPDLNRPKQVLEGFGLESLIMVGTIRKDGKDLQALILDTKAQIHRVVPGNYLGKNHGKVVAITEKKMDLLEIIPDGQDGWVERPRIVSIREEQ